MSKILQSVDERTKLAGTNRLEVLLFNIGQDSATGRNEVFGINVFKVREVMHVPEITRAPDMPSGVEGVVSLRGAMVPVINLQQFCGIETADESKILMITEYNQHVQGFLVHSVDTIQRLDWKDVKAPPAMLSNRLKGLVTAIAELSDDRLVMILDVEKVLAETTSVYDEDTVFEGISPLQNRDYARVLFADDSSVARKQITSTLDRLGIKHMGFNNGAEAWAKLIEIADRADSLKRPVSDELTLVLTDVEMPEMDGYVLTRNLKGDPRFNGVQVMMHSSLTGDANQAFGENVGVDAYVAKFQPIELAAALEKMIPPKVPT